MKSEELGQSVVSDRNVAILQLTEKEYVILDLLIHDLRGLYGLQIVAKSQGRLKKGTVYVVLQRMQDKGLIDSKSEARVAPEIGIPRRIYTVSGYGERVYKAYTVAQRILAGELVHALS